MTLLGEAAIAMWWDIDGVPLSEFEDWHSHEHMPERLRVPGFLRGTRWLSVSGGARYFVMYEVESLETISSRAYLERLNNPTPWSTKMMPHFRNMTRSACRVRGSFGSGTGQALLTILFSPVAGKEDALVDWLTKTVLPELAAKAGMVGAHVLQTVKQSGIAKTKEQDLRGSDASADWVLLANGYDSAVVDSLASSVLTERILVQHGFANGKINDAYRLAYILTKADLVQSD
ncbi:MAG: hypothetical protein ACREUQ_10330 [Burkholderiales bacterium]